MIEWGEDLRFPPEPSDAVGISGHGSGQHLEGNVPFQRRVVARHAFPIPPTPSWAVIS